MKKKIVLMLLGIIMFSCSNNEKDLIEGNKIIKSGNEYYLNYEDVYIKLEKDIYITKERKFEDYLKQGILSVKDNNLITDLTKYFPHGFKSIIEGEKPKEYIDMPIINLNEMKIIDAIKLEKDLSNINIEVLVEKDETKEEEKEVDVVSLKDKNIAILNANAVNGASKKLGEKLEKDLEIKFKAENYKKIMNYNYIVNHKLSEKELDELVLSSGLDKVKIIEDETLFPEMDAVIILGKNDLKIKIDLISDKDEKDLLSLLSTYQTRLLKEKKYDVNDINSKYVVMYNKEDRYIASKINLELLDTELKENNEIKDKILIIRK